MSYILEALKKAEQKRELEERQTSIAFSTETVKPARKMAWWPYVLIAVLVVNASFLIRWVWFGPAVDVPAVAPPSPMADPIARPSDLPTAGMQEEEKAAPRVAGPAERTERKGERAWSGLPNEQARPIGRFRRHALLPHRLQRRSPYRQRRSDPTSSAGALR